MNYAVLLRRFAALVLITGILSSCPTAAAASTEETVYPEQTAEATVFSEPTDPDPLETTEASEPETEPLETVPPETTVSGEETVPEETEVQEETAAATVPAMTSGIPCSVAYVKNMPDPASDLVLRGTVVLARDGNYVLQDRSGGILLVLSQGLELSLKDKVEVTGDFDRVFTVNHVTALGTADLPKAKETSLRDAPEALRVAVRQGELRDGRLVQEDMEVELRADLPASAEGRVDAYGVLLNGVFYADAVIPLETEQEEAISGEWNFYFGLLHAHTDISDGLGTVEEAFQYAYGVEDLDFFAVTDHSESLENAAGSIDIDGRQVSAQWAAGKAAAEAVTDETFVGIFGYEMSWPEDRSLGHISTFHTPGWESWDAGTPNDRNDDYFVTLPRYYEALTTVPDSISQFNHPGHTHGNFRNFRDYSPAYDQVIHLIEVGSGDEVCDEAAYHKALDAGWHLAPTINQNNKEGAWGDASSVRTVILAKALTENALYEAMRDHRVYATEDQDLQILYRLNGAVMGGILGPQEVLTASVALLDPTDEGGSLVEIFVDEGTLAGTRRLDSPEGEITIDLPKGYTYYYLRITQADGDVAITAPVWVDSYEDVGIRSFRASRDMPLEGEEVTLTLEAYNNEPEDFIPERLTIYQGNEVLREETRLDILGNMDTVTYTLPFRKDTAGAVELTAELTGTIGGDWRRFKKTLTFFYQARPESIESCQMAELRSLDNLGLSFCVRGYVTAGNDDPNTTFPDAIYIQDDTGGIMVTGVETQNIEIGQPMEVIGILRSVDGNLQLEQTDHTLLEETFYRYVPRTMANKDAMNLSLHGGELLQVQGTVMSVTTEGKAVTRFTLKDIRGDVAAVVIEDTITSGATGRNELASQVKKGRTVRAIGLLHVDENGECVLRVRNCDEVVYVIPTVDPSNPPTGDRFWLLK